MLIPVWRLPAFPFSLEGTINHVGLLVIPFRFSTVSVGKFFNGNFVFFYEIIIFKGKLSHLSGEMTKKIKMAIYLLDNGLY